MFPSNPYQQQKLSRIRALMSERKWHFEFKCRVMLMRNTELIKTEESWKGTYTIHKKTSMLIN